MKRFLVPLIKLLVFAALMTWVFSNIQLGDRLVEGDQEVAGEIVGAWDATEIQFQREGDDTPEAVSWESVRTGLLTYWRNMSAPWFLLGAFFYFLNVTFASTRWWWLLRVNKLPISYWAAYRFTWMGLFFNNVVPGQTGGDLVKAIYVMKRCHGARVPAMMSVVVDRIMGLASLSILAAIAVLFYLGEPGFNTLAIALWAVLGGVVLCGVVAFSRRVRSLIRLKQLLEMLPDKVGNVLRRIDEAVFYYRSHKLGMALWMFGGLFNHIFSVLAYACVGRALGIPMPVADYFVLIPVIVTLSAIPIAPNGWGVGEALFMFLFGKFGAVYVTDVTAELATSAMKNMGTALSVVFRIHLTAWSLVGGLVYFLDKDKVTREELAAEAEREDGESNGSTAGDDELVPPKVENPA